MADHFPIASPPTNPRRQLALLVMIITGCGLLVAGGVIAVLYQAALAERRAHLTQLVRSQARLIEAIGRFDEAHSREDHPQGAAAATLSQVMDAHRAWEGLGATGEFVIGRRVGADVEILVATRFAGNDDELRRSPAAQRQAEPLRRALRGETGTMIGRDYRGRRVVAAYEPVAGVDWGLVAKLELAEVRHPFLLGGVIALVAALLISAAGAWVFLRLAGPLVQTAARSQAQLHTLLESAGDGIVGLDPDVRVTFINAAGARLLGWERADLVGRSFHAAAHHRQPQGDTYLERECGACQAVRCGSAYERRRETFWRRDGSAFTADMTCRPLLDGDRTSGAVLTFRDVSERERLEVGLRRLAAVVRDSNDAVTVQELNGRITAWNGGAERMYGWTEQEALGMPVRELIPEAQWPQAQDLLKRIHDGERIKSLETRRRHRDGREIDVSLSVTPLTDESGRPYAIATTERDITERKKRERQLQTYTEELKRSNEELSQFAYVASHDLQEPLRMISSYLQLLVRRHRDDLPEEAREFIDYAVDGAQHMKRLINALLSYSRVETQGKPLTRVDVQAVFDRVMRNYRDAIAETKAEITHDALPEITGDDVQIGQLLQNLIDNALKFRGAAPPRIHIGVRNGDADWEFSVEDRGIGIDPEQFERIFTIFQRLHPRGQYQGTGIGLALCRKIVERHGGHIWVESEPGAGTTFRFTLPKASAAARTARGPVSTSQ